VERVLEQVVKMIATTKRATCKARLIAFREIQRYWGTVEIDDDTSTSDRRVVL
jgi:hypothetical protein